MNADDTLDRLPLSGTALSPRLCPACGKRTPDRLCSDDATPTVALLETDEVDRYIGRVLDNRFRIIRRIGQGGMGRVYLGTQLNLGQQVAIKVILPDREGAEAAVQRFHREAKATTRLTSPHVVRVYDFGVDAQTASPYLVMEYLEGRTLAALLRAEGPLRPQRVAAITAQVVRALVEAEARSIIHRDIKPDNIFLVQNGEQSDFVKVMDLGVARSVAGTPDGLGSVTRSGNVVGTPAYMSPEQISGQHLDTRSDLYAVGCLIHEMLTGLQPYSKSEEGVARMVAHVTQPPPTLPSHTPHGEPIPDALRVVHDRLLKKVAGERPASAALVLEALLGVAENRAAPLDDASSADTLSRIMPVVPSTPTGEVPSARRRWMLPVAVLLVVAAGITTWALTRTPGSDESALNVSEPVAADVTRQATPAPAVLPAPESAVAPSVTSTPTEPGTRDPEAEVRNGVRLPQERDAASLQALAPEGPAPSEPRDQRPPTTGARPGARPRPTGEPPAAVPKPETSKPTENPW